MSDTESAAEAVPAAAPAAAAERKPRRLRGHKKGAVTCCVASSARPGVVASAGEVRVSAHAGLLLLPEDCAVEPASRSGVCPEPWSMGVLELPIVAGQLGMLSSAEDTSRTPHGHWLLGAPLSFSAALLDL